MKILTLIFRKMSATRVATSKSVLLDFVQNVTIKVGIQVQGAMALSIDIVLSAQSCGLEDIDDSFVCRHAE